MEESYSPMTQFGAWFRRVILSNLENVCGVFIVISVIVAIVYGMIRLDKKLTADTERKRQETLNAHIWIHDPNCIQCRREQIH